VSTPEPQPFAQLRLGFTDPIQHDYEVIRDVLLLGKRVTQRSEETGLDRTTVADKARRFLEKGMLGLLDERARAAGRPSHPFPNHVAGYILLLKQLYPPIHDREIVRILQRKFDYQTNHHTIRHFLDQHPIPVQLPLPWTTFHQFEDAYQARWTVVRMYYEGWHMTSIAGVLDLSPKHVRAIITAFKRDEFAGLEDHRARPATHPANQLSLPFLKEVLQIQQEYPRAGRFRVRGVLAQRLEGEPPSERTIGRAMALNRQHHGAPGPWITAKEPARDDDALKHLPYRPEYRHHYWFLDFRYLVRLDDQWTYSLCVMEGYSRRILAGMATPYQDEIAVLQLLNAALTEYGCPAGIVSDNGAVFTAEAYQSLLAALKIEVCYIEKGKPWQNLIEAMFKVELRLADAKFEQAQTLDELQRLHADFVETFNSTDHWAHQDRAEGVQTPDAVLGWVRGRMLEPGRLHTVLREIQVERTVNRTGYVSIQRFYIYAERGLSRRRVSIWLYDGRLHVAHRDALLAQYTYHYDRPAKRLRAIEHPQLYQTVYASPQLELFELDDAQWRKVWERDARQRHVAAVRASPGEQLALPVTGVLGVLLTLHGLLA
jgi:transposase InsO family protein/transposase